MNIVDSFVGSDGLAAAREAGSRGALICVAFPQLSSGFSRHCGLRRWVWGGVSRADANLAREAETARLPLRVRTFPPQPFPHVLGPDPSARPTERPAHARLFFLLCLPTAGRRDVQLVSASLAGSASFPVVGDLIL